VKLSSSFFFPSHTKILTSVAYQHYIMHGTTLLLS